MKRITLHDIDPAAFTHPADQSTLATIRAIPGAERLVTWSVDSEESTVPHKSLGSVRPLSPTQREYDLYIDVLHTLDAAAQWPIFVKDTSVPNAVAVGGAKPHIMITRGLLDTGDEHLIRFAMGHEVGHLMADHGAYRFMMSRLMLVGWAGYIINPLVGGAAILGLKAALTAWIRTSEYTADRAGLLALQDVKAAAHCLNQLRTGTDDTLFHVMGGLFSTHPERTARMSALDEWAHSGAYERILAGTYARRSFAHTRAVSREDFAAYQVGVRELSTSAYDVHDAPADRADWQKSAERELSELDLDDDDDSVDLDALISDELDDL